MSKHLMNEKITINLSFITYLCYGILFLYGIEAFNQPGLFKVTKAIVIFNLVLSDFMMFLGWIGMAFFADKIKMKTDKVPVKNSKKRVYFLIVSCLEAAFVYFLFHSPIADKLGKTFLILFIIKWCLTILIQINARKFREAA